MRSSVFRFLSILTTVLVTSACEEQCMSGVTNAFIQKYVQGPLQTVAMHAANDVISRLPESGGSRPPIAITSSILTAYREDGSSQMLQDIFPRFFHGKCEREDRNNPGGPLVDPPGCPNPDCPVVCGTPGSLCHFYPKLRYIAFNATRNFLTSCSGPESAVFKEMQKNVMQGIEETRQQERKRSWMTRRGMVRKADSSEIKKVVREVLESLAKALEESCGGSGTGVTHGLPNCSWESEMKQYIQTFP